MPDEGTIPGQRFAIVARLGAFGVTAGLGTLASYPGMDNPSAAAAAGRG